MNWGRYAEIFDYERESGRLVQTEAAQNEAAPNEAAAVEAAPAEAAPVQPPVEDQSSTPTPKA
jgi:hypothetical protein